MTYYESLVEQRLPREDQKALALLAIHDEKLYKLTHASFGDYLEHRWKLSRSRGYQLVHSARVTRSRLQNGQPPPPNERQARQFAADGTQAPRDAGEHSYERCLRRVTRYLAANLAKSPPGEEGRWLQDVRKALDRLEQDLDIQPLPHDGSARANTARPRPAEADPQRPRQANQPPSTSSPHPHGAGASTAVSRQGRPAWSATTEAAHSKGLPSNPEVASGAVRERLWPPANAGPVLGLTMEQARKFGFCPR